MSKQKGFSPILIIIVIALILVLIGGFYYSSYRSNPVTESQYLSEVSNKSKMSSTPQNSSYPNDWQLVSKANLDMTKDWKNYTNDQYSFEFMYPKTWVIMTNSNLFQAGDLVGYSEKEISDKGDFSFVAISNPINHSGSLDTFVKDFFKNSEGKPSISLEDINGLNFQKAFVCGLGCYTYYFTLKDGYVYIIDLHEGSDSPSDNDQDLTNIINTFKFKN